MCEQPHLFPSRVSNIFATCGKSIEVCIREPKQHGRNIGVSTFLKKLTERINSVYLKLNTRIQLGSVDIIPYEISGTIGRKEDFHLAAVWRSISTVSLMSECSVATWKLFHMLLPCCII